MEPDSIKFASPKRGEYKFDEILLDDPRVWAAFSRGDCVGIFQVESQLGTIWCKKLRPQSIEELSDVISLIRPGPLESRRS